MLSPALGLFHMTTPRALSLFHSLHLRDTPLLSLFPLLLRCAHRFAHRSSRSAVYMYRSHRTRFARAAPQLPTLASAGKTFAPDQVAFKLMWDATHDGATGWKASAPTGTCAGGAGSKCTGLRFQPTIAATCTDTKDSTGSAACVWTQTVGAHAHDDCATEACGCSTPTTASWAASSATGAPHIIVECDAEQHITKSTLLCIRTPPPHPTPFFAPRAYKPTLRPYARPCEHQHQHECVVPQGPHTTSAITTTKHFILPQRDWKSSWSQTR